MQPGTILLLIVGGVLLWLLVDVLFTGGSMTGGMAPAPTCTAPAARRRCRCASGAGVGGMMMMASNPVGLVVLLLVLALGALVAYLVFFT